MGSGGEGDEGENEDAPLLGSSRPSASRPSRNTKPPESQRLSGKTAVRHQRTERRIRRTKRRVRSELQGEDAWYRQGFRHEVAVPSVIENVERARCSHLSVAEFHSRFEEPSVPCIIDGLAQEFRPLWEPKKFLHHFGSVRLKVGDNDRGRPVRIKLRHFRRYLQSQEGAKRDDSPLYVFDSHFGERAPEMLRNYQIPPYFAEDLFRLGGDRRPPHRWIVFGPYRSGSGIHIDPLGTSAWNMLLHGHKRWVRHP
jgi:histone arginine demethylase JMJD6